MIIIDYEHNPNVPMEMKLQTLAESVQMALSGISNELAETDKTHGRDIKDILKTLESINQSLTALTQVVSTINNRVTVLEGIAEDAIIVDSSVTT